MIEFHNLTIGFKNKHETIKLVKDINFKAFSGESIVLLGRNGAGKSTFFKTVLNLIPALNGQIYLDNKELNKYSAKEISRLISFVSTEIFEYDYLKVLDLVSLGRYPYSGLLGKLNKDDLRVVEEALLKVDMLSFSERYYNNLSDGEKQKVRIAAALAQETKIIILDEPAAHLDYENKSQIYSLLRSIAEKKNKLIIYSSHNPDIVLKTAHKVLKIEQKKIKLFSI